MEDIHTNNTEKSQENKTESKEINTESHTEYVIKDKAEAAKPPESMQTSSNGVEIPGKAKILSLDQIDGRLSTSAPEVKKKPPARPPIPLVRAGSFKGSPALIRTGSFKGFPSPLASSNGTVSGLKSGPQTQPGVKPGTAGKISQSDVQQQVT